MKEPLKRDFRVPVVAIVIIELAALVARAFLEVRLLDSGVLKSFADDLSYLIVPPIMVASLFPVLQRHWSYLRSLMRRQDLTIRLLLLAVLLGFALRIAYWGGLISLVSFGILRSPNPDAIVGPEFSFACPDAEALALSLFVLAVLTPVVEEVANRGLILPALMNKGRLLALMISSLLFAVMHTPRAIPIAFIMGIFLGLQMIKVGILWAPIITHATYNAMNILDWDCLHGKWNPTEVSPDTIGAGLIALAIAIASIFLSMRLVTRSRNGVQVHPDPRTS